MRAAAARLPSGLAKHLTREAFRLRQRRLRSRLFLIVQCSLGGALAWFLAYYLLQHPQPFFAPVTVLVTLGLTYGQRLRRVVELTVGVAIGVLVGDLLVHLIGSGPVQLALIVFLAMSSAAWVGAGGLLMIQAGVQSMIVVTLVAQPEYAFSRWLDAVIGGAVAITMALVSPRAPLLRPRREAADCLQELSEVMSATATAVRDRDLEAADEALKRARASEPALESLREATREGLAAARLSPLWWGHQPGLSAIAQVTEPLDRAVRNARVLARRASVALWAGEQVPRAYVDEVADLAAVLDAMAGDLRHQGALDERRARLVEIAGRIGAREEDTSLSGEVVRAQVRSIVVDLLMLTGMSYETARSQVPQDPTLG